MTTDKKELVTISVAARALGINRKTVYKYIERGQLTRIDEGGHGYIPADQVRELRAKMKAQTATLEGQEETATGGTGTTAGAPTDNDQGHTVTVPRVHYDGLLTRLGQLEAREQLLLEHKTALERQASELEASRIRIAELETQLTAARRPWWRRLLG